MYEAKILIPEESNAIGSEAASSSSKTRAPTTALIYIPDVEPSTEEEERLLELVDKKITEKLQSELMQK